MEHQKRSDRPIDRKRNSGGSFKVGEAGEINRAMITTSTVMYNVTDRAVYAVQMADQIDPDRTNINLPQIVPQRVLEFGAEATFVARTFMTAGVLFDRTYLGQTFDVDAGKSLALEVAKRLASMRDIFDALVSNERRVVESLGSQSDGRSFRVPETPGLRTKVETFLAGGDRVQEALFSIAHQFYERPQGRVNTRASLIDQVERQAPGRIAFHAAVKSIIEVLHRVREHRNASVHDDGPKSLVLRDFHLLPSGEISAPLMEIRHPTFPLAQTPVAQHMAAEIELLTEVSEALMAWLCSENIALSAPIFQVQLAALPDGESRDGSRYYYHTNIVGPLPGITDKPPAVVE